MKGKFPRVNYIGNKQKISSWIIESLPIKKGVVLDLFSGGGSVAYNLKLNDFCVITNDSLYSSFVVNKALIENNSTILNSSHILKALEVNVSNTIKDRLSNLSEVLYFEDEIEELSKLVEYTKFLEGYEKYLYLSLLRRSMVRKLPYSRMNINWSNIKKLRDEGYSYRKYGRKRAYHNKPFTHHMLSELEDYNNAVFTNNQKNQSFHKDGFDMLLSLPYDFVDLVYIDPPYPGTMNNYWGFYGKFDEIFEKEIEFKDFTNSKNFLENIRQILDICANKTKYALFSLNSNSDPSIKDIEIIALFYGETTIFERKHNYQVSGKKEKNKNYEQLLLVEFYR